MQSNIPENDDNSTTVRDDLWLQQLLDETWDRYFSDVRQENIVRIEFGRRAKRQLGSIRFDRADPTVSIITLNGLFRLPAIPDFVVKSTLIHELIHYAHGFNSPLAQKHVHPHAGGVIRAEYAERGLEDMYLAQKKWLKEHWANTVQTNFGSYAPRRRGRRAIPRPFWL